MAGHAADDNSALGQSASCGNRHVQVRGLLLQLRQVVTNAYLEGLLVLLATKQVEHVLTSRTPQVFLPLLFNLGVLHPRLDQLAGKGPTSKRTQPRKASAHAADVLAVPQPEPHKGVPGAGQGDLGQALDSPTNGKTRAATSATKRSAQLLSRPLVLRSTATGSGSKFIARPFDLLVSVLAELLALRVVLRKRNFFVANSHSTVTSSSAPQISQGGTAKFNFCVFNQPLAFAVCQARRAALLNSSLDLQQLPLLLWVNGLGCRCLFGLACSSIDARSNFLK